MKITGGFSLTFQLPDFDVPYFVILLFNKKSEIILIIFQ